MTQKSRISAENLLRKAIDDWPEFEDPNEPVSGSDAVEWLGQFLKQAEGALKNSPPAPQIHLDISTAHLPSETRENLEEIAAKKLRGDGPALPFSLSAYEYGFFLTVPPLASVIEKADHIREECGPAVLNLLIHADHVGARVIQLDADGDIAEGLAIYEDNEKCLISDDLAANIAIADDMGFEINEDLDQPGYFYVTDPVGSSGDSSFTTYAEAIEDVLRQMPLFASDFAIKTGIPCGDISQ